ncbi:hypothetical protein [Actinoallomurus sp. NPDC050550]|uniref:hypothetical protein n=1 Tax=Actinoallomurus sp. NPDC050550 TaxID=3154937 RepID=UPI00340F1AC1
MLRTLATIATSSAVVISSALPAAADSKRPTTIIDFASSANTVAYQQPVTFTGELIDARTKDPLAGEPVQIRFTPPGASTTTVAAGTTGSDGRFTINTTLPSGGRVSAVFPGDTGLDPGSSPGPEILLQAAHLPSRLVLDPVPASVPAGTPVTFSGTMQVQVNGAWEAFPGAPLTLTMEPASSSQSNLTYVTTSGADGRFSLTEPVSGTSDWSIDDTQKGVHQGGWFQDFTRADYNWIDGVSRTRVAGFSVPSHDEAHHAYSSGLYATGTVERWNGNSWVGLIYGWVDLYYRPKGSTTWHKDYATQTDANGQFRNVVGIHLGTVDWQARVRASADTLTSTSAGTVTSTVTDKTHFRSASITRRSSKSVINGQVADWYSGPSFSDLRGLKVRLYYRARGSKTWHSYRTATLGRNGVFRFSVSKNHGYYFKVTFPTQGAFQSSTSRTL